MTDNAEIINYVKQNPIGKKSESITTIMLPEIKNESIKPTYPEIIKPVNRCQLKECNKKLSLIESTYSCKCQNTYCTNHKHSTHHKCTYDYKKDNNHNLYKAEYSKLNKI